MRPAGAIRDSRRKSDDKLSELSDLVPAIVVREECAERAGVHPFEVESAVTAIGVQSPSTPETWVDLPSNSATSCPVIEPRGASPEGWGVDKLACSFPIIDFQRDDQLWGSHKDRPLGDTFEKHQRYTVLTLGPEASLLLSVFWAPAQKQYYARFEFNPSRLVDPTGAGLCAVTDLPFALGMAWEALSQLVRPQMEISQAKIRRLDVARDFFPVLDCTSYLTGWRQIPAPYSRKWVEYDSKTGRPQTLYKGTKTAGLVRAYDKHAESPAKTTPGTFRVEVEAHEQWCKTYGGIERVEDLSTASGLRLLANRFEWAGCSTSVSGQSEFMTRLGRLTDKHGKPWPRAKKATFIGEQLLVAQGVAEKLPKERKAEYNRALRITGIPSLADLAGLGGNRPTVHLDFETGREVIGVAA